MEPVANRHPAPDGRRRVVIIDDHQFFAACLRSLLDAESDLVVCDVATAWGDVESRLLTLKADLLVIDLTLGAQSGLELGRRLRREHGIGTPILFISTLTQPPLTELASVSACAFVRKTDRPSQLLHAVRAILGPRRPADVTMENLQTAVARA